MKMTVTRHPVCAADDQLNDLVIYIDISHDTTLADCVEHIKRAMFLQFSSSHSSMTGYMGDQAVVRMFAKAEPEYLASPSLMVAAAAETPCLSFRF
jgi:PHP family Zn ribbon phosphoesterase